MQRRCPQCQLDFERNPGAFIGGIGVNTTVTAVAMVIALVASFVWIDGAWYIVGIPVVAVALIVPALFFANSKTLWLALEYISVPVLEEAAESAKRVEFGDPGRDLEFE